MDNQNIISIARDFSVSPGPRYIVEGDFSGELFRNTILEPRFVEAIQKKEKLTVDLDGTLGYGTSFLEEAFGGLARLHGIKLVQDNLEVVANEESYLKDDVAEYIEKAND
ncbi:STAS-like domain-containing protein [Patescibacteria group bacterium]|nr:STAS-like domain-containing protein [Patescibacteria group bacterium]